MKKCLQEVYSSSLYLGDWLSEEMIFVRSSNKFTKILSYVRQFYHNERDNIPITVLLDNKNGNNSQLWRNWRKLQIFQTRTQYSSMTFKTVDGRIIFVYLQSSLVNADANKHTRTGQASSTNITTLHKPCFNQPACRWDSIREQFASYQKRQITLFYYKVKTADHPLLRG